MWRQVLRKNFTQKEALADFLELTPQQREKLLQQPNFPLLLPLRLAQKIAKGTLDDPILRQFVPLNEEKLPVSGFLEDPVGDCQAQKTARLLCKYEGRALIMPTGACAMHCRYCFRQHFDYATCDRTFADELQVIKEDSSLREIILSGGDPLSLSDSVLDHLLTSLAAIPHLRRIRFHTRVPIGIPERIDASFLALLAKVPQQIWFIIHANHPKELDEEVLFALKKLHHQGVVLLCQSVLLRGVNDKVEILQELCETLIDHGIQPYYLHQLDRVQGAAHFEVPEEEGLRLMDELSRKLPGYGVPRYVREVPGQPSKTTIKTKF